MDSLLLPCTLSPSKRVTALALNSNNQCFDEGWLEGWLDGCEDGCKEGWLDGYELG